MLQTMTNFGHQTLEEPYQLKKFDLKQKKNRLIKMNEKTSRKLYELECHNIMNDKVCKDDAEANSHKTGLP